MTVKLMAYATNRYEKLDYYFGIDLLAQYMETNNVQAEKNCFVVNVYETDLGYTFRKKKIEYEPNNIPEIIHLEAIIKMIQNYKEGIDIITGLDKYLYPIELDNLKELKDFAERFKVEDGDIIGHQVLYFFLLHTIFFILQLKQNNPDVKFKTVLGGYHITLSEVTREFLSKFDFVEHMVINDGRKPLLDIATGKNNDKIQTGYFNDDKMTFPAYNKIDRMMRKDKKFQVMSSVGCVNNCRFCASKREYLEYDLDYLEAYILEQNNVYPISDLVLVDDALNASTQRLKDLCRMFLRIRKKINNNLVWRAHGYADFIDDECAQLMIDSGCDSIFLGTESFDNEVLKYINKRCTVEKYLEVINALAKGNVEVRLGIIVDLPNETDERFYNSLNVIKSIVNENVVITPTIFKLYAGSNFYNNPIENGININFWDQSIIDQLEEIKGMKIPKSYNYINRPGELDPLEKVKLVMKYTNLHFATERLFKGITENEQNIDSNY